MISKRGTNQLKSSNVSHYDEYSILDAKIKEFEAKKKDLRSVILKDMIESGKKTEDTAIGKFTLTKLKTWTYPEEVIEIGENFKAAKAKAESTGDATYIEEDSFRFTQIKL